MNLKEYIINSKDLVKSSITRTAETFPINRLEKELDSIVSDLELLELKLDNPLNLVIMGEVKAGKSTLLNALVEKVVAPTNVLEATAAIMVIKYSNKEYAKIIYKNGEEREDTIQSIFDILSSQNGNIEFFQQIKEIEVGMPLKNLKELHIVDTPGLSTLTIENQQSTKEYIQNADVVLWVINGHYLGQSDINDEISNVSEFGKPMICAINRIDEIDTDIDELLEYAEDELGIYFDRIFPISALESVKAIKNNDQNKLEEVGYTNLLNYLKDEVERNEERVQKDSIENSTKSLLDKEIALTENMLCSLNEITGLLDKYDRDIDKHSKDIISSIKVEADDKIKNNFMKDKESEILRMIDNKDNLEDIQNKAQKYLNEEYVKKEIITTFETLQNDYKDQWENSLNEIKIKLDTEIEKLKVNELKRIETYNNLFDTITSIESMESIKEGAIFGGVCGLSLAGYAAWIGPYAASITFGASVAAFVPPLLIAGAVVGLARLFFSERKPSVSKEEYENMKKSIINNFDELRSNIRNHFEKTITQAMTSQNEVIKSNFKQATLDDIVNGYTENQIKDIINNLEMYKEKVIEQKSRFIT